MTQQKPLLSAINKKKQKFRREQPEFFVDITSGVWYNKNE